MCRYVRSDGRVCRTMNREWIQKCWRCLTPKPKKKSGCGGSVKWEQPDNYKHPEISPLKFVEKKKVKK